MKSPESGASRKEAVSDTQIPLQLQGLLYSLLFRSAGVFPELPSITPKREILFRTLFSSLPLHLLEMGPIVFFLEGGVLWHIWVSQCSGLIPGCAQELSTPGSGAGIKPGSTMSRTWQTSALTPWDVSPGWTSRSNVALCCAF